MYAFLLYFSKKHYNTTRKLTLIPRHLVVLRGSRDSRSYRRQHRDPPCPVERLPSLFVDDTLRTVDKSEVRILLVTETNQTVSYRFRQGMRFQRTQLHLLPGQSTQHTPAPR